MLDLCVQPVDVSAAERATTGTECDAPQEMSGVEFVPISTDVAPDAESPSACE